MRLSGLHLLLTYRCTLECDHCFVWSAPDVRGQMTLEQVQSILRQAQTIESIKRIYFEGGEPFLCYDVLMKGAREALAMGFEVGVVTNAYWATSEERALQILSPLRHIHDFSVSSDQYHSPHLYSKFVSNALNAARQLNIPVGTISISQPEQLSSHSSVGQIQKGNSQVMYRGRAAVMLTSGVSNKNWEKFTECVHENLENPSRVHVDHEGYIHICQGITLGNIFETPLNEICASYHPKDHPITGPLINGGPTQLARKYGVAHRTGYADGCHLCYETRQQLQKEYPKILGPKQMYRQKIALH